MRPPLFGKRVALMDNFLRNSLAGSSACLVATSLLNPLEVIKIQIQTGKIDVNGSMLRTGLRLFRSEGAWYGLMQPGLLASCSRELFYSSLRFAIYPNLRKYFRNDTNHHLGFGALGEKFGAGLIAGAIGSSLANPADLLKIRMQLEPGKTDSDGRYLRGPQKGKFKKYKSTGEVFKNVLRSEGLRGFYRGVSATCLRSSLLTAGQLSSYDHGKQLLKASGFLSEGLPLHLTCSVISGLVAATVCAPADRIKTAMMVGQSNKFTKVFIDILKSEGIRGFYRGWTPSYFRLAPHFIIEIPRIGSLLKFEPTGGGVTIARIMLEEKTKSNKHSRHENDRDSDSDYNKTRFTSRKLLAWQVPEDIKFSKKISERFDPSELGDNQNIKIDYYRQPSKEPSRDPRDYRSLPQVSRKEFKPAMLEASASSSEWIRGEPARHIFIDQISPKLGIKSDLNLYALLEEIFQLSENDLININLHYSSRGTVCASVLFSSGYKAWEIVRRSMRMKMTEWTMWSDSGAHEFERIKLKDRDREEANRRDCEHADGRERETTNRVTTENHQSRRKELSCSPFVPCLRIPFSCGHSLPFRLTSETISSAFPSTRFPSFSGVEEGSSTWHIHFGREIDIVAADEMLQRDLFQWKGNEFYFERWNLMKGGQAWSIPEHYKVKKEKDKDKDSLNHPADSMMDVDVSDAEPSSLLPPLESSEVDYFNLPKFIKKRPLPAVEESEDRSNGIKVKVKRKPIEKRIFVSPPMAPIPISEVPTPPVVTVTFPPAITAEEEHCDHVEIDAVPLKSGSARTEGFLTLHPDEKQRVRFKGFLEAFSSNNSANTSNTGDSSTPTTESRSSRAQNRRPVPATAMMDLFKVSPLQSTQKLVSLRNSSIHSYGLVLMESAEPGDLILEYVGELVRSSVANIREWKYEREYTGDGIASSYLFRLDAIMVIDATHRGSLARFINHSCDPNCVAKTITLNGSKRIVMYAKKSIKPGEEITYDYKFPTEKDPRKKVKCLCGSSSCRKFLN